MSETNITRREFLKGHASKPATAQNAKTQMTMRRDAHGSPVSLLGYGMMRLPTVDGAHANGWAKGASNAKIDQDLVNRQIDYALEHGVNYFDTSPAYCRGESETVTGIALSRHPRSSYKIATKLSNFAPQFWPLGKSKEMFEKSLKALQTDYIDYYLLHSIGNGDASLGNDGWKTFCARYIDNGALDWLMEERKKGRIRNLGFSFHGDRRTFDWCIENHSKYKWDFVQIQMNYVDWRHAKEVNARNLNGEYLYGELSKRNIPAVIMEPLLGGRLGRFDKTLAAFLKPLDPNATLAEWSFRFCGHFPGVMTCLSGMTEMQYLEENCRTFSPLKPLNEKELETLEKAAVAYVGGFTIPCTDCKYCMPCPYGLDIPGIFAVWNDAAAHGRLPFSGTPEFEEYRTRFLKEYNEKIPPLRQCDHCVTCGLCAPHCPQSIDIPGEMVRMDAFIDKLKNSIRDPAAKAVL